MNDVQIAKGMALPATLPFPTRQPALLLPGTSYWGEMGKTSGRGSPLNGHLQEQNNNSDMPLIIHSPALRAKIQMEQVTQNTLESLIYNSQLHCSGKLWVWRYLLLSISKASHWRLFWLIVASFISTKSYDARAFKLLGFKQIFGK